MTNYSILKDKAYRFLVDHYPRIIIDHIWQREYGYKVNWKNPRDLNEKIQWLICYGDTSVWPLLADKYRVREYVAEKGLEHLLPELFGVWTDARDIDFDLLPDTFVLKCNHDSGSTHIIDKSKGFHKEKIVSDLNCSLKQRFGYRWCEPHYNRIPPMVIAEEYFTPPVNSFSNSLVDYKIWCFGGKPSSIFACFNRTASEVYVNMYDLDWNVHPEWSVFSDHFRDGHGVLPRPDNLPEMLTAAGILSSGLPEARIDLYDVNGCLKFGEITLTSSRGRMEYFTKEYLIELGQLVPLQINE